MRYYFFFLFILIQTLSIAQEKTLSFSVEKVPLISVLDQLESTFDIKFSYNDATVANLEISLDVDNKTLLEIIDKLNKKTVLNFDIISERNIIIKSNTFDALNIEKSQVLHEVIIKNYLAKGLQKQIDGTFNFSPKDFDVLPGITEPDIFQTLQLLPGIISPNENATDIFVRGGTPDQNLILWDGIKIYQNGHLFGSFSAFNPYVTSNIKFINKGTNAKYGGRVSSVIDMKTSDRISNDFNGGFGFNLMEADIFLDIPVIENKLSVIVSARRSLTDIFETKIYEKLTEKIFQNTTTNSILKGEETFRYFDYSVKANLEISKKDKLNFSFIYIENEIQTVFGEDNTLLKDQLETENVGYNLNWTREWKSNLSHNINIYTSNYQLNLLQENQFSNNNFYKKDNDVVDTGINLNFNFNISESQQISAGYQFSNNHVSYSFANQNKIIENNNHLNTNSVFTSYSYKNDELFDVIAGLRFSIYSKLNELSIEPRLNIHKKISPNFSLNITAEKKTQAISQINETIENSLSLENQIWIIANNNQIPLIESMQFTGGITYLKDSWLVDIDAYFKEIEGITSLNNGFIDIDKFGIKDGESYIKGIDFHLKKQFSNYKTWMSYTLSSVENHFNDINNSEVFSSNSDIRQNFNWSNKFSYKNFQIALGWRWHSGKPYSKAINIMEDENGNKKLEYDGINNYRLPNYNRLDFSGTYNFDLVKNKNLKGKLGVSVLNILNESNILNRSFDIGQNGDLNQIDTKSLERVTNIVFRVNW